MKKSLSLLWMCTALLGLVLAGGCQKDDVVNPVTDQPPAGVTNETTAMQSMAVNDQFVQNDEQTFNDAEVAPGDYGNFDKVLADITPLRYGRFVTSVTRTVTVTVDSSDTTATAVIDKNIVGVFKIRAINGAGDTVTVEKPFNDASTRKVVFRRVGRDTEHYWKNWMPVSASLVQGGTVAPNNTVNIVMVETFLPNGDSITVTDPTNYFLRYKWIAGWHRGRKDLPVLLPGQLIRTRVTVSSASADTDIVSLRFGYDGFHKRRAKFPIVSETNNGDGTYTRIYERTWSVNIHPGYFNAGVEAMTKGTVYDDQAPYSVSWWGIPYRVVLL
jgi:hypothetical protein